MTVPLSYYGSPDPLPVRRVLRAGPLSAIYEAGDLRYVKVGGGEVCRRWYAAVRDHNWGTVPGVISDEVIEETADGFRVTYTSTHQQGDIHFVWRAEIVGAKTGLLFRVDGVARSRFRRNRIGFCILHPPELCAGRTARLGHSDQTVSDSAFPDVIAPTNPFHEITFLRHDIPGGDLVWQFAGDEFETEDQRNWIDASYKTFCTPLNRPFPVEVNEGDVVKQHVSLLWSAASEESAQEKPLRLSLGEDIGQLPQIGIGCGPSAVMAHDIVCQLRPVHLRVEVDLTRPEFADHLRLAVAEASAVATPLELSVVVSDAVWEETRSLIELLHAIQPQLARVMAIHDREWSTPERIITPIVEAIARFDSTIPVFVGTRANFTELNRGRPSLSVADGVCYSVQPQEHAFDNSSLVECCAAIADTVRTARSFCGEKPISVGPITLRKRVNPYATGSWEPPPPDARQGSLFGAVWTLGALKYLAESGVAAATFYETTGPRGVMDGNRVFPLFHVLADANEWFGAMVVKCESSDPLRFDALIFQHETRTRVILANMTAEPQTVSLDQLPAEVRVRTLDETSFEFATTDPIAFRQQIGETHTTDNGRLTLSLKPYAYVRIDG